MNSLGIRIVNAVSLILCFVLIAPILIVVYMSFDAGSYMLFPPKSLSLRWFDAFFQDLEWMASLRHSFQVAVLAAVVATVLGFLGAYALVRGSFRNRKMLLAVCLLPLIISPIITAVALYFVAVPLELLGSTVFLALSHAALAIPVVMLIMIGSLQNVDISLERAAAGMGAGKLYTFWAIVIPIVWPGILSAAFFSFLTSFDELIIALFLSGLESETMPVRIWNSLLMNMEPIIAAISTVLIGMTVVLLLIEMMIRKWRSPQRKPAGG